MTNSLNLPTNPSHNDTYSTFGVTYTYDFVNDVWLANRPPTIDDMVDVDTTTIAPTANQVLSWDVSTNNFIPTDGFDARLSASTIDWSAVQNTPTTIAGYGITEPEGEKAGDNYDSYTHLDVTDKWVLLMRFMPEDIDTDQRVKINRFSSDRNKVLNARKRGANDRAATRSDSRSGVGLASQRQRGCHRNRRGNMGFRAASRRQPDGRFR